MSDHSIGHVAGTTVPGVWLAVGSLTWRCCDLVFDERTGEKRWKKLLGSGRAGPKPCTTGLSAPGVVRAG